MRLVEAVEEWPYADDRVMQRSYTAEVCVACAWFCFGIDSSCHTSVVCALQQAQLQQGQYLTHCCRHWKAVHKMEICGTVAA